jgi:hypothetical protein
MQSGSLRDIYSNTSLNGPIGMELSSASELAQHRGNSSKDLGGLIREIVKEDGDDEASTVDGDEIDDKIITEK